MANVTPERLLAQDQIIDSVINDSLGTPTSNLSPYLIDTMTAILVVAIFHYSKAGGSDTIVAFGFLMASVMAVWGAVRAQSICRYIVDTPKSTMQSAAQGFVELQGSCDFFGNRQSQGFMSGPPCVWHRYTISGPTGSFQMGASSIPFVITDESGSCVVNPAGAKVISSSTRTWRENGKRFSSRYICPGAEVYVLGELRTRGGSDTAFNQGIEVSKLLSVWKKDKRGLNKEFDVNGDGTVDADEWEAVRGRATHISRRIFDERSLDPVDHIISKPKNGMPFIISDRDPTPLGNTFRLLAYANIVVAVACFVWACLLLSR